VPLTACYGSISNNQEPNTGNEPPEIHGEKERGKFRRIKLGNERTYDTVQCTPVASFGKFEHYRIL